MPELGRAALIATLGLALWALLAGSWAARTRRRRLAVSAQNALLAAFGTTAVAAGVLVAAFLRDDFGFVTVADASSRELPLRYAISAGWSSQAGSLLLWLLVLTGFSAAAVLLNRRTARDIVAWATPILGGVAVFFAFLLVVLATPFATQAAPTDGSGLNPSLQNPYMMAHPPLLYLGFVGLTVPFAFALGSLFARRTDERWIVATRRWTLFAWTALGIGQLLGSKWAYEEVGWGGYFAWDPVENAALMPWLAATAYLHSVMIQEKRGMLKVWNVLLVILAFSLSLFGTFLTRSGILSSIHSFTQSSIGPWFLGFICVVVLGSLALVLARLPLLRSKTRLESLVSREATFLYNNLLLVALTLTILWGVAYPILSEAVRGEAVTLGRPYYDFFLRVFGLPLLLLMGIGPLVAWRRASLRNLGRTFAWPAGAAVVVGALLLALGAGSSIPGLIAYTFSAFVLASIALEFARGTRARRALSGGSWPRAFSDLIARNRRRYGGYVVHAAIVLVAIGIAGSSAYDIVGEGKLARGESLAVGDYRLTYRALVERPAANATEVRAVLDVQRGGDELGTVAAGKNAYTAERQISNEVGIRSDLVTGEDLFVIAEQVNPDGTVYFRVFVKPLVNLIWLAGFVFLLGSLIAMWPDAREQRRLSVRYAAAGVPAER
ncbi:MAG TPA: cytochrome c-type biogenesis CcmF C-terminal domain-containing protein [Gaiellaceae bacterium]|nr:cytochrome c-type biogenesis CcmF C-terminal domain-containing protein [Gaiellaceae bacterium]